jgi:hypothetical protein
MDAGGGDRRSRFHPIVSIDYAPAAGSRAELRDLGRR